MSLIDFACKQRWAMRTEELRMLLDIVSRESLDPELARQIRDDRAQRPSALAARAGGKLDGTRSVAMRDGVAILEIVGPIVRRADMFSDISGATSVETLAQDFTAAMSAPNVDAILLAVDSPGGEVTGVNELAQMIEAARGVKSVWAYVEGLGASAAYWLASAAERIVIDATADLGSIGVVMAVRDPSKAKTDQITFVSSQSPNKRPDPTTEAGRSQLQTLVDDTADVFVEAVARQRGISNEAVIADFGQGGVKVGKAAVAAGMADQIGTFEETVAALRTAVTQQRTRRMVGAMQEAHMANSFWKDFWTGARESGALEDAPADSVVRHAAVTALVPDPRIAELEAQLKAAQAREVERAAATFADAQIRANRALPAERDSLIAAYSKAAQADSAVPGLGMVAALEAAQALRPAHSLTKELIPAGPIGALPPAQSERDAQIEAGKAQASAYLNTLPGKPA